MAAPARAASRAESAICRGVTGIAGCLPTVSPAPVMAQEMITSWFMRMAPPRVWFVPHLDYGNLTGAAVRRLAGGDISATSGDGGSPDQAARRSVRATG